MDFFLQKYHHNSLFKFKILKTFIFHSIKNKVFFKKIKDLSIHLLQPLLPVPRCSIGVGVVVLVVLGRGIVLHQAEAAAVALVRERLVQPATNKENSNIGSISLVI